MASLASSRNEAFQVPGSPSNLALLEEVDHRIYIYDLNTRGTVGHAKTLIYNELDHLRKLRSELTYLLGYNAFLPLGR